MDILKPLYTRPKKGICSGKFGKSGKMKIKPYSVPKEEKVKLMIKIIRNIRITETGCWEWTGRIHNGYSVISTSHSSRWGHRVSYAVFKRDIKEQMHIDHKCRNRLCVNPFHLKQVTPIENYLAIQRRKLRDEKRLKEENGQLTLW